METFEDYMKEYLTEEGIRACRESDFVRKFLEKDFERKQTKDYMECRNCSMWHNSGGMAYTCHGTFEVGSCEMMTGCALAGFHECEFSLEERSAFMLRKNKEQFKISRII